MSFLIHGFAVVMGCWFSMPASAEPTRTIKTIQPKRHTRTGRWEISPRLGMVVNDAFIRRYMIGGGLRFHPSEIFSLELGGDFSPDLGRADWKPITAQLLDENEVFPGISRWIWSTDASVVFSPIHAKAALFDRIFDVEIYIRAGAALIHTEDDPETIEDATTIPSQNTMSQNHPALLAGGGLRIYVSQNVSLLFEGRSVQYMETLSGDQIQNKSYAVTAISAAFLFPP